MALTSSTLSQTRSLSWCHRYWPALRWLQSGDIKLQFGRLRLKRDGTRAETRFRLSPKRSTQFKSVGASVQSTTGSRGVRISSSNAGYTMFRGSVKSTGYPLHSSFSPSLPLPCVTVCHHVSNALYYYVGRDSVVCVAIRYGLDGPEIGSRWGRVFPHTSRPVLRPTQTPGYRVFPGGKAIGEWRWPPIPI